MFLVKLQYFCTDFEEESPVCFLVDFMYKIMLQGGVIFDCMQQESIGAMKVEVLMKHSVNAVVNIYKPCEYSEVSMNKSPVNKRQCVEHLR